MGLLLPLLGAHSQAAAPSTEPMLRIEAGMHTAGIKRIDTDTAGRYAVTASEDKTARVWDVASGRLLQVLRPPIGPGNEGKLYTVAISPDGSTVAAAGWTGRDWNNEQVHIYLFDRASGQLQNRFTGLPNAVFHLSFSPDGRWLAATLWGRNGVRVWDWRRGGAAQADSSYASSSYGVSWSAGGRFATTSEDGKLRLYRVAQNGALTKLAEADAPGGKRPLGLAFHPDGSRIAVGYRDSTRVDVVDGQRLTPLFAATTEGVDNGNLASVAWSRDGRTLVAAGRWDGNGKHPARLWPDAGQGQPLDVPLTGNYVMDLAALPTGGWLVGAADPAWGVLSAQGAWQPLGRPPTADLRDSRGDILLLAGGGRRLQFGYEPFGKPPHQFDLARRSLAAGSLPGGQAPDTTSVPVQNWFNRTDPTLRGQPIKLKESDFALSLAATPDGQGFVLGTGWRLHHFSADGSPRWQREVPGSVWGVNIPTDGPQAGKIVVAAYADGTMSWHRLSDGAELLAFFPHADRKRWVLWTPSGYYDASPGGEDLIGWHVNRGQDQAADFFPASRFRSTYHRPDIIDRVLDTLDVGQALAQANEARGNARPVAAASVTQTLPPVVELITGSELSTGNAQVTLRVRGRTAADAPVTAWRVRVNGQAVSDSRGLGRQEAAPGAGERDIVVPLPPQDSEIQVFAENRHGVSTAATVRVKWTGAAPATPAQAGGFQIQPKLYVLAVGVAQYQHKEISKLGLSAKDARDFAAAMQRQKGRLYREVEVKVLTDAQASRDDIVDGLEWLQKQVTQHDVGMVFIAGHGVNDSTQGYTFLPVNADPDRLRRTGVAMDEFRKTLSSLAGKALFFFDTCHSGNVLGAKSRAGANDVSGVINELASAENGVVVFSSSTGRQLSYEDPAWGNGAFTKALVEGLDGGANYQKTGRITHTMLNLYISERVKTLTGGKQTPVTQAAGGVPDYPVAWVK
jgi:WD40 repeat protein